MPVAQAQLALPVRRALRLASVLAQVRRELKSPLVNSVSLLGSGLVLCLEEPSCNLRLTKSNY
jgi:hypothetical protein